MTKIYIVGGPGSGKTTYAKKLSKTMNIPHFDLDEVKWKRQGENVLFNQKRDRTERAYLLNNILTHHSNWICEGVYFQDWIIPVIEQADEVIVLQPSVWLRQYRVLRRSLRRMLGVERKKYRETPLTVCKLLSWSQVYDKKYFPLVFEKIYHFKTPHRILKKY